MKRIGSTADLDARSAPGGQARGTARVHSNHNLGQPESCSENDDIPCRAPPGGPSNDTNAKGPFTGPFVFGAGTRSRTRDLLITNQLLYQLSYAGIVPAIAAEGCELLAFRDADSRPGVTLAASRTAGGIAQLYLVLTVLFDYRAGTPARR
jgi:hypothetical protein